MKKAFGYASLAVLALVVVLGAYYGHAVFTAKAYTEEVILPDLSWSRWRSPGGEPKEFEIEHTDVDKHRIQILIKVQDPGFYHHRGIDLSTPGAGLTTITQAIVKKLYFKRFKAGIAKIKQSLIARYVVHNMISKDDQLNLFLNMMFFGKVEGRPLVGLESAAQAYYQKSGKAVSDDQYIALIAMIVMPGTFHIEDHPQWNQERVQRIKALIDGRYRPVGLMDQFYGELSKEVIEAGLPKFSYFPDLYRK